MNNLSKHFNTLDLAQTERLLQDIDLAPLEKSTYRRIALRIRQKRAIEPAAKKQKTSIAKNPMRKSAMIWLSAAACLLLVVGVLSIPSVASALYNLLHPDFETEKYMLELPEDRVQIQEVEEAIAAASPGEESFRIELLGEYTGGLTRYDAEYNESIPKQRIENGFPAFDKDKFSFLRDLRPEVREVLYDGKNLTVNTYFHSDHAADFLSMWAGVDVDTEFNLDMTCFDYIISVNGQPTTAYNVGYSSGTMLSLGSHTDAEIEQLEGFWHTLEIKNLPQKLPDGEIEMTILYYIYDGDIDDMGAIGNIGRVIHTFTFDATEGNKGEVESDTAQFQGEAVMTIWDWEKDLIYNRIMQLDELKIKTEATFGKTGIKVNLKAEDLPEEWKYVFLFASSNSGRHPGIGFDLYVDGAFVKSLQLQDSAHHEANFELPIFPSEYDSIGQIVLRPSVTYLTSLKVLSDESEHILTLGEDAVDVRGGSSFETCETVPLTGCDIIIPLPNK